MRRLKAIFLLMILTQGLSSQVSIDFGGHSLPPLERRDTIDKAKLCVHYQQIVQTDSTNEKQVEISEMILQVGVHLSKYSNYVRLINDSINRAEAVNNRLTQALFNASLVRLNNSGDNGETFRNYPTGKILYRAYITAEKTSYEEEIPVFAWEFIANETTEVLGYSCQKATCFFRGRNYTAWFAPEIPVNNGPWKFQGLPGLILKVEDDKMQFSYTATAIYRPTWEQPITKSYGKNELKTTREKFNKAMKRYKESPMMMYKNSGKITSSTGTSNYSIPYNPIELF